MNGKVNPSGIHVNIIKRDGTDLILNTRSAHALEQAGFPRSSFTEIDRTGDELFESLLIDQLRRDKLTNKGTNNVTRED